MPVRKEQKIIERLTNSTIKKLSIDNVKVESLNRTFTFQREFNKLQKEVLIILPNLKYTELIEIYEHLIGIQTNERDTKPE